MVQRSFVRKIRGISQTSYWEQLKELNLYSLERRRDRYRIIYVWNILEHHVPNFTHYDNGTENGGIKSYYHIRHGRKCSIRLVERGPYRSIINGSLSIQGARLFNSLPRYIRNLSGCSKEHFKRNLDKFLATIPDEPQIKSHVGFRCTDSNNLVDMIKYQTISIGLNELDG